jgi:hypothetical protein
MNKPKLPVYNTVSGTPAVQLGDIVMSADGSRVVGELSRNYLEDFVPAAVINHVADEVQGKLAALEKASAVSEVMQDVVAALVAEVNRLEADLARERERSGLVTRKYMELVDKVADYVVGVIKFPVLEGVSESTCQDSVVV